MFKLGKPKKKQIIDSSTLEEICLSTWEALYRYIYYKVQNREEAEDITQEAYVKALSYSQKSEIEPEKYIAFLKTVALNVLRDRWRKNKRQGIKVNLEAIDPLAASVEDPAETASQRVFIENALNKLNEEQRTVIELRIIKGFSVAEAAKKMNKTEGAVRVLQYRTLQILEKLLEKQ